MLVENIAIQHRWDSALHEAAEVAQTSAMLRICIGSNVVTRNEDEWAQTVRDDVRLSAYPLALWLASSWWRLRWEPLPTSSNPSNSWRMAHELRAAGFGYLWPRMMFASDGEHIHTWAAQSRPGSKSPVRYLVDAYSVISAVNFERTVDEFVSGVIARLHAVNHGHSILHSLWQELLEERQNGDFAADRKVEAMLGFDPDDAPQELLDRFKRLASKAGNGAVEEIAPVCATRDPERVLELVESIAESRGLEGRFSVPRASPEQTVPDGTPSWDHGRLLAHKLRADLGLDGAPIADSRLCELVGLKTSALENTFQSTFRIPLGLAIREGKEKAKFVLRKRNKPGRRFEIARFICDDLLDAKKDRWLPATDLKTSRQKAQRAFAGEFLCPIESLEDFLDRDYSTDAIDAAAEVFGVSTRAVETQLVNHHILPPEAFGLRQGEFGFPYTVDFQ